jgi:hypothetical protein
LYKTLTPEKINCRENSHLQRNPEKVLNFSSHHRRIFYSERLSSAKPIKPTENGLPRPSRGRGIKGEGWEWLALLNFAASPIRDAPLTGTIAKSNFQMVGDDLPVVAAKPQLCPTIWKLLLANTLVCHQNSSSAWRLLPRKLQHEVDRLALRGDSISR